MELFAGDKSPDYACTGQGRDLSHPVIYFIDRSSPPQDILIEHRHQASIRIATNLVVLGRAEDALQDVLLAGAGGHSADEGAKPRRISLATEQSLEVGIDSI